MATQGTSSASTDRFDLAGWPGRAEAALRRHPVLWAIGIASCLFAIFVLTLAPAFDRDDDVVMMFIADGTTYAEALPDLVFINVAYGLVLNVFYTLVPALPWYSLFFYFLHVTALATILYLVFTHPRFRLLLHLPALAAVMVLFNLYSWMNLQFTTVSMLLAAAGVLLYVLAAHRPETATITIVLAASMLGVSSFIRWTGWAGVLGMALPLLAFTVTRVPWRRQFLFGGVMLLIVFGAVGFQGLYYAGDDDWAAYNEFNDVRGDLHVTARLDQAGSDRALLEEIGWSRNDFAMFRNWFFLDATVFTTESLDAIMAGSDFATAGDTSRWLDPLVQDSWPRLRWLLLAALAVPAMVIASNRERIMVGGTVVWSAAISAVSILYLRFPDRVAVSVLAFVALTLLLVPGSQDPPRPRTRRTNLVAVVSVAVLVVVALVSVVAGVRWVVPWSSDNRAGQQALVRDFDGLETFDPDGVYVTWTNSLHTERAGPLSAGVDSEITVVPLGWQARTPFHSRHIRNQGVADIHTAIASDDGVYLVTTFATQFDRLFSSYMTEHYGFDGLMRPVRRSGQGGQIAVFDTMVDFEINDGAWAGGGNRDSIISEGFVEISQNGERRVIPLNGQGRAGEVESLPRNTNGTVKGWAADVAGQRKPDLIVVIGDGQLAGLGIPFDPNRQVANRLDLDPTVRWGFTVRTRGEPAENYRVFAIYGDEAAELPLASGL